MWWIDALTVVVSCATLGALVAVIWVVFSDPGTRTHDSKSRPRR